MKKKLILGTIIAAILIFGLSQIFLPKKTQLKTIEVSRGNVFEEISEIGIVEKGKEIKLSFQNGGRIEKIFVEVGEEVKSKQPLAKLETHDLELQLAEAEFALKLAQANLEKILAGATPQEKEMTKKELEMAENNLSQAEKNLKEAFSQGFVVLNSDHIALYNSLNFVKEFVKKYIRVSDPETRKIILAKDRIEQVTNELSMNLQNLKSEEYEKIEKTLSLTKKTLEIALEELETIRKTIEESVIFRESVLPVDKNYLDNQKISLNQALSNTISAIEGIYLAKTNLEMAKAKLKIAESKFDLITSPPRETDINLYQLQIDQTKVRIERLRRQIEEATLKSPCDGKILKILKREGEIAQPMMGEVIFVILPKAEFQVKVDIYEKEIVKIKEGMEAEVFFVAFPGQKFIGKISFVEPAPKIKDGAVYFETTIDLETFPENLKPGMSCDVKIKTSQKEGVLVLPREAVKREGGKYFVEVLQNGKVEKREIEIGIGEDLVEVISGLKDGEKVILR